VISVFLLNLEDLVPQMLFQVKNFFNSIQRNFEISKILVCFHYFSLNNLLYK
jgi:hypothetical protein